MIAQSQTQADIFRFGNELQYVGLKSSRWEEVVAKRIVMNQLSRERRITIALLAQQVKDDSLVIARKNVDLDNERHARQAESDARVACQLAHAETKGKLKRRTTIEVAALALLTALTYHTLKP